MSSGNTDIGLGGGGGSVTSVGLTLPSWLTVTGSPLTSAGTLAVTATTGQTANQFLGSPNGSSGAVSLRALVAADLPAHPSAFTTTAKSANYTATTTDNYIGYTSTSSAWTVSLPQASTCPAGQIIVIKDESNAAGTNNITITPFSGDTIDNGLTTYAITANSGVLRLVQRNSAWWTW